MSRFGCKSIINIERLLELLNAGQKEFEVHIDGKYN
jgi:hypothetical protein